MSKEEKQSSGSSVLLPVDTAKQLNVIGKFRRDNKIFDWTQPKILIDLIEKEYKRVTKKL